MDNIGYISLYIKCDGFAYPFRIFYKYNNENIVYNRTFENVKSANVFLKELYEKVEPGFLHYNYTMQKYDATSKGAYFFNIENDAIKKAYEYDGLAKPVYNLRPLKRAYKELFGKKLNLTGNKNKEDSTEKNLTGISTKQEVKNIVISLGVAAAITSPFALLMYQVNDAQKKLKQAEESAARVEEMEKHIQELESKTINMMDTIKQNNR